ncbi:ATP synthase F0 subunit B [Acidipila sp. EB88]|uniref:ATP synthase F0 subunit B n=1 Tax=Acidipila sp. EB88 TaxID=2305226 RepID=UPI000F5FCA5C|nr:ATP synthase F0 subunit B [Acidipila sp. EB88]RRA48571.1 hypothetical protein D1Y84_10015 [Acidipila sp. EB88]
MDDILRQLGDLFLGSIPTMVIFLLLVFCYTVLVHRPLGKTLAQRRERTAGAVDKAHAAIALAEAKTQEYEARLRAARLEIQQNRDRQAAAWSAARDKAVAEAREAATGQVRAARAALAADAEQTRAGMAASIDALAQQILSTILPPAARDTVPQAQEARS